MVRRITKPNKTILPFCLGGGAVEGVPNTKCQTNHQPQNFRQLLVEPKIKVFSKLNTLDLSLVLTFVRILLVNIQVKYYQGHLLMKDFLRDDLRYKEIPSKPQEKDPYHHHS